jgi:hypothetical protein
MSDAVEHQPGSRVLSVIAVTIALCGLALSMWMNWRFGWSQAGVSEDRAATAGQHMLSDPAAAVVTAIGGRFIAKGRWWSGFAAILFAVGFIGWSMVGVNGFMSARIGASEGHKASIKVQEDYLRWAQGQTVNFDRPKSERQAMVTEVRDATKKLAEAAATVPDAQAASLAEMFGTTPDRVQRTLVTISSGMAQAIKAVCMFFGVLAWPNKRSSASSETSSATSSASSAGSSSGGSSSGNSGFPGEVRTGEQEKVIKFPTVQRVTPEPVVAIPPNYGSSASSEASSDSNSPASSVGVSAESSSASSPGNSRLSGAPNIEVRSPNLVVRPQPNFKSGDRQSEALADLVRLVREKGSISSQRQLCERWHKPKSVVSEWLSDWEADGYIVRRREGNQKSISIGSVVALANRTETICNEDVFASVHPAGRA